MLSCKQIAEHSDEILDGSLSFRQKCSLRLHLLMCRHCNTFVKYYSAIFRATLPHKHEKISDERAAEIVSKVISATNNPDSEN